MLKGRLAALLLDELGRYVDGLDKRSMHFSLLDGDVTKVAGYAARFAGVGFPGETYQISYWRDGDKILFGAGSKQVVVQEAPPPGSVISTTSASAGAPAEPKEAMACPA